MDDFGDACSRRCRSRLRSLLHFRLEVCAILVADVSVFGHAVVFCHDDAAVCELQQKSTRYGICRIVGIAIAPAAGNAEDNSVIWPASMIRRRFRSGDPRTSSELGHGDLVADALESSATAPLRWSSGTFSEPNRIWAAPGHEMGMPRSRAAFAPESSKRMPLCFRVGIRLI